MNEEKMADDLSTTVDPNAVTNEDDGQRTDIGSGDLSFSATRTLVMSEESEIDKLCKCKSCTEVYSTTHDETQTDIPKSIQKANNRTVDADGVAETKTKNDVPQHPIENSPTEKENGQGEKGENSNNFDIVSAPLFSEPMEQTSMESNNSDKDEYPPKPKKKRLGMTGPAFTKCTLSINVSDVSRELNIPKEQNVVEACVSEGKQVVRKYMCKKCPEMFFTKNSYERHLMHNHKIRNVGKYEPEIIEKTICIFGQDGYETTYRKIDTMEDSQKVKLVEYSCDDDNDKSGMQNERAEDGQIA